MYRLTHRYLEPAVEEEDNAMEEGEEESQEGEDDEESEDEEVSEEQETPKRQLKKRRSEAQPWGAVGTSLSKWTCEQFSAMFGSSCTFSYSLGRKRVEKSTSFYLSEICMSANICQAQKFQELRFLHPERKNLRDAQ